MLLGYLRSFVHLHNTATDKLWKGYAPIELEVTTEQVDRKSDTV